MSRYLNPLIGPVAALAFAPWAYGAPELRPIGSVSLLSGSPLHIPLDGFDPTGQRLTYDVRSEDSMVTTFIPRGNRSLRIVVVGFGEMIFQLFEQRVPRATSRIIELAQSGFYDGVIFHRVIDNFIIQGGDPTGTGSGGSDLGPFDDQFHVDLQHNRSGLLSMAKAADDTNDSQFFVTEGSDTARHLDFNHSIFGVLVEGEEVREAISDVDVGPDDRPRTDIVMQSVEVFEDTQNAVLMLKAPEGFSGSTRVTVTVTGEDGTEITESFPVNVTPDTVDGNPFLADVPPQRTKVDTELTFQLEAIDVEGDEAFFLDESALDENGLAVPVRAHPDLRYSVDFESGLVRVMPMNGLEGAHSITVSTARFNDAVDYQVVPITIEP